MNGEKVRAYLLLNESFKDIPSKILNSFELESIIILTDKQLYDEFIKTHPDIKTILIDLFADEDSVKKSAMTSEIMKELLNSNSALCWNDYRLTDILVNQVFSHIEIIYNLINGLAKVVNEYSITNLKLYGGNPGVQFLPLSLSEGERPFKFIYKRAWFLNHFVNEALKDTLIIEWEKKTPTIFLKTICIIRPLIILLGKLRSIIKRTLRRRKKLQINIKDLYKDKPMALFLVRNPIQIEPLIPIYNEFRNRDEFTPLFLTLENYSNNKINNELRKKDISNVDLYSMLTIKKILKSLNEIANIKKSNNKGIVIDKVIEGYKVPFLADEIIRNLFPFIIDVIVLEKLLNNFTEENNNICCLINNETHSYHSAIQAEWIRKRGCSSIGIQHVSISNKFKPKISRVDTMFMMSKKITDQLSEIKPDEKFIFLGPVSYDLNFNTTTHRDKFNRISIFTQPDDFKKEYLQIIEHVIDILSSNNIDVQLNIKLHPRERDLTSFKKFEEINSSIKVIGNEMASNELIKHSDLVISIHSSVLMQSIIIGTPAISVNYGSRHDIKLDFINHSVTKKINSKNELEVCLLNLNSLNNDYYSNRKLFLGSSLDEYDGNAATKVYDYIKEVL